MDADCLLCGRRDTFSTSGSICVAGVALSRGTFGTIIDVRGSLATTVDPWTPTVFYVAGVTLSAPQARFAWQAWHFRYLHRCPRKLGDEGGPMDADCVVLSVPPCQRKLGDILGLWRLWPGRRGTFNTCGSLCLAGVALSVPP